jgi:hypothetical protein
MHYFGTQKKLASTIPAKEQAQMSGLSHCRDCVPIEYGPRPYAVDQGVKDEADLYR